MLLYRAPHTPPQDFVLDSPLFAASSTMRYLHFYFHMLGSDMGTLLLEAWQGSGWGPLWSRSGEQGVNWELALVSIPQDAKALRFVGTTGDGFKSDMALDGIATGLPTVDFQQLSCSFNYDYCLWQSAGNASWKLVGGESGDDRRWLEASGNGSQAVDFILETAALFNTTDEKVVFFAYELLGSDFVALELQHKTSAHGWRRLFLESGPSGAARLTLVTIPAASIGLRFITNVSSDLDVVKIQSLHAEEVLDDWSSITCGFESDLCAWATSSAPAFLRISGSTPSSWTGPEAGSLLL